MYLATDSGETHARFARKCGARVRCKPPRRTAALRQTSLLEAAADLLVCACSDAFIGSHGSSFSDAIAFLRKMHGRASAADEHVIMGRVRFSSGTHPTDHRILYDG